MRKKVFRFFKVFLAYALLWPISAGDKMVRLSAPSDSGGAVSSPWVLYRDLGRSLFGSKPAKQDEGGAFRMRRAAPPDGLLAFQKPDPAPRDLADGLPRRLDPAELSRAVPDGLSPPLPSSPVIPFHLNSKK